MNLFVYGSLKRGFCNNSYLDGYEAERASCFGLKLYRGPGFPFAVKGEGIIQGELYDVSQETLKMVDLLEGHPVLYCRELLPIVTVDNETEEAWVYISSDASDWPLIASGIWKG